VGADVTERYGREGLVLPLDDHRAFLFRRSGSTLRGSVRERILGTPSDHAGCLGSEGMTALQKRFLMVVIILLIWGLFVLVIV
jgi:hypothetical protein